MQRAFLTCPVRPDRLVPGSRTAQSITTLDALITAAHLATSPGSMAATSAGVLSAAGMPCLAIAARTASFESCGDGEVEALDHRSRRAHRREQSRPGIGLDSRHAALSERRHRRKLRHTLGAREPKCAHRARLDLLSDQAWQWRDADVDTICQQLREHG